MKSIIVILIGLALLSCNSREKSNSFIAQKAVAATIDSIPIFVDSVDQTIQQELYDELNRIYLVRKIATQQLIKKKLLEIEANKHGISVDKLEKRIYGKINNDSLVNFAKQTSYPDAVPELRETLVFHDINSPEGLALLTTRYKKSLMEQFIDSVRGLHTVKELLQAPLSPKVSLGNVITHYKSEQNSKSKIVMMVISDFDCHACREHNPLFNELYQKYKDKIQLGFTHYSSYISHSAIASECASNQGKFWQMHDSIFAAKSIPDSTMLFEMAKNLNLNMNQFQRDYRSVEIKEKIRESMLKLESAGIYGTPTILINGRLIFNNSSLEEIESLLLQELKVLCE